MTVKKFIEYLQTLPQDAILVEQLPDIYSNNVYGYHIDNKMVRILSEEEIKKQVKLLKNKNITNQYNHSINEPVVTLSRSEEIQTWYSSYC